MLGTVCDTYENSGHEPPGVPGARDERRLCSSRIVAVAFRVTDMLRKKNS